MANENQRRGTSDLLDTAERRAFVLQLRKAGATYREIARAAEQRFPGQLPESWGARYAHKDVQRELDKLRAEIAEETEQVRQLELERLNDMLKALWEAASRRDPDHSAIDRVLRIMERRAKLRGLDFAQSLDVTSKGESLASDDSDYRAAILSALSRISAAGAAADVAEDADA